MARPYCALTFLLVTCALTRAATLGPFSGEDLINDGYFTDEANAELNGECARTESGTTDGVLLNIPLPNLQEGDVTISFELQDLRDGDFDPFFMLCPTDSSDDPIQCLTIGLLDGVPVRVIFVRI